MQKPSFVTEFSIHPYTPESVDTQQALNMPNAGFCFAISFFVVHITYGMLFRNNDIKAVDVGGTNIADIVMQPEIYSRNLPNSPYTMPLGVYV